MKKFMYFSFSIVSFITLLVACAPAPTPVAVTPTPALSQAEGSTGRGAGDTLRILNPDTPTTLNPHLTNSVRDWEAARLTYEPLASFDKNGTLIPFLAVDIPNRDNGGLAADGKSVTWRLQTGVKWSDGEPFTADDVLFTYQFVTNPEVKAASAATYGVIKNVEVIDDTTVKVNFKDVNPAWALPFVGFQGMILPRHIFAAYNGANAREAPANTLPVGTGPYRALPPGIKPQEVLLLGARLVETNKIVFEPNPYFREPDKPYFSRVIMRGGGTPKEAGRLVLEEGQVDYAYNLGRLDPATLAALQTKTGQLVTNFGSRVERIMLNRSDPNKITPDGERSSLKFPHPFFSDKAVRQAFAYAIDRETLAALFGSGGKSTTNNLVAPPQYASPNVFYTYNPNKANQLLDEAGWVDHNANGLRDKNGVELKVVFQTPSTTSQPFRDIVKKNLEAIGVEVDLKIVDSGAMFGDCAASPDADTCFNADMQEFALRSVNPDPSAYMQGWTCDQIPQKANNWTGWNDERWCSPTYDALVKQSTTELDPEKRRQMFIKMNDMLIEDVVMMPVVYLAAVQGVGNDIVGVNLTPWDTDTWNIKDWRRVSP